MPVDRTSSPPRSKWLACASSITWTQRTGASSRSAPASTLGTPWLTTSSARTSATVSSTASLPVLRVAILVYLQLTVCNLAGNPGARRLDQRDWPVGSEARRDQALHALDQRQ